MSSGLVEGLGDPGSQAARAGNSSNLAEHLILLYLELLEGGAGRRGQGPVRPCGGVLQVSGPWAGLTGAGRASDNVPALALPEHSSALLGAQSLCKTRSLTQALAGRHLHREHDMTSLIAWHGRGSWKRHGPASTASSS